MLSFKYIEKLDYCRVLKGDSTNLHFVNYLRNPIDRGASYFYETKNLTFVAYKQINDTTFRSKYYDYYKYNSYSCTGSGLHDVTDCVKNTYYRKYHYVDFIIDSYNEIISCSFNSNTRYDYHNWQGHMYSSSNTYNLSEWISW